MARNNKSETAEIKGPETELNRPTLQEGESGSTPSAPKKDLAAEAYVLFCKGQAEGDFPAWAELDPPTQKLWRDSYAHVAGGGRPRTDYEHVVKYHLLAAQ
jgi:hypothetical protein